MSHIRAKARRGTGPETGVGQIRSHRGVGCLIEGKPERMRGTTVSSRRGAARAVAVQMTAALALAASACDPSKSCSSP
jgi:hypothetical protein